MGISKKAYARIVISHPEPEQITYALSRWSRSAVHLIHNLMIDMAVESKIHCVPSLPRPREFMEVSLSCRYDAKMISGMKLQMLPSVFPSYEAFNGEFAITSLQGDIIDRYEWGDTPPSQDLDYILSQDNLVLMDNTTDELLADRTQSSRMRNVLARLALRLAVRNIVI